jgi:hypothetical protein
VNCETTRSITQDYLERRLVQLDRSEFLRHIDQCAACERELVSYRDVFTFLTKIEPFEVPQGFQNAIISQLKSEGHVHQPKVAPIRRWVAAFVGLPGVAKYPLAALAVVAAVYLPLKLVLMAAGGVVGRTTVAATDLLVSAKDALAGASFLTGLWDVLSGYVRAVQTVFGACLSLLNAAGESFWFVGAGVGVVLAAILLTARFLKKRSTNNAPLCL